MCAQHCIGGAGVWGHSPVAVCDLKKRSDEVTIDCYLNISIHIQDDSHYTRVEDAISSKWLPQFAQRSDIVLYERMSGL